MRKMQTKKGCFAQINAKIPIIETIVSPDHFLEPILLPKGKFYYITHPIPEREVD